MRYDVTGQIKEKFKKGKYLSKLKLGYLFIINVAEDNEIKVTFEKMDESEEEEEEEIEEPLAAVRESVIDVNPVSILEDNGEEDEEDEDLREQLEEQADKIEELAGKVESLQNENRDIKNQLEIVNTNLTKRKILPRQLENRKVIKNNKKNSRNSVENARKNKKITKTTTSTKTTRNRNSRRKK